MTIKGLSLWQPWAGLMAAGAKRIETRSWSTGYRGLVAIHAARKWNGELSEIANQPRFRRALHPNLVYVKGDQRSMPITRDGDLQEWNRS